MNENSIQRLRLKFILLSMASFAGTMIILAGFINVANIISTQKDIYNVLDFLVDNEGRLYGNANGEKHDFSPEFRYSTRFFVVFFDEEGQVDDVNITFISAINKKEAVEYAMEARKKYYGFNGMGKYLYKYNTKDASYYYRYASLEDGRDLAVFLDCRTQISINARIFYNSLIICFGGLFIIFILVTVLSEKAVKPEIRNAERQKKFITNASHELKTPIAVIRANTEVQEMMNGKDEWTESTMRQVDRMSNLINSLVAVARAEETADRGQMSLINVSETIEDTAIGFESIASSSGITYDHTSHFEEGVHMVADPENIVQLCSLLLDNAMKYCDKDGTVTLSLETSKKSVILTVSNSYKDGENVDYSKFFDRFWRADSSHSADSEKTGFGIGLSIVENLVNSYNGTIDVSWNEGVISFKCVLN
ncbi:MAG: HAMP domain-containing histidine kinase [Lachnospiraceae bacterium]|nr:HAMP domain-containing histidine kinase [Lachnospiraceae bacterium]